MCYRTVRCFGQLTQHIALRFLNKPACVGIVDDSEMRWQARLDRKTAEDFLAESMNGAEAHSAGAGENAREQPTRFFKLLRRRFPVLQPVEFFAQFIFAARCPEAELFGQAVRHLRRRRARES